MCNLALCSSCSFVLSLYRTCEERVQGHWCQFLVLQAQLSCDYLLYWYHVTTCMGSILDHVMVHRTNKTMSPDPFPLQRVGSWNETRLLGFLSTIYLQDQHMWYLVQLCTHCVVTPLISYPRSRYIHYALLAANLDSRCFDCMLTFEAHSR